MIRALALVFDEHKILRPLERIDGLFIEYLVVEGDSKLQLPYPDIILTVSDWRADIAKLLLEARTLKIPTLMFQDGTLDWIIQNLGERYAGTGGPTHFHPILTDKIAAIGFQSARLISSWNDSNKVEVVGSPILQSEIEDAVEYRNQRPSLKSQTYNILVTSTRQGWFCEVHRIAVVKGLFDLKSYLLSRDDITVCWRLSRDLAKILGVENDMKIKESYELVPLIKEADFVISFQSTVVVEAMLYGKPVAIIDYLNVPQYYGTGWLINHKDQIPTIVDSLIQANPNRMIFQEYQLRDILFLNSNSIDRAKLLIKEMVKFRVENESLDFPSNLLSYNSPFQDVPHGYSEIDVFPAVKKNYFIDKSDLIKLVTRYTHENQTLRRKLKSRSFLEYLILLRNRIFQSYYK